MAVENATNERARALKRLKKILALTQSTSPGEAAAALHQAQVLMKKYGFESADAQMACVEEAGTTLSSAELSKWESSLVGVIATSLGVIAMIEKQIPAKGLRRSRARVVFVGESCKAEIAVYAFESLRRKLRLDTSAAFNGMLQIAGVAGQLKITSQQRSVYACAWCASVRSKIQALAPAVPEFVHRYVETRVSLIKQPPAAPKRRTKALDPIENFLYSQGAHDGRNVDLHQAVHQGQGTLALPVP